MNISEKDFLNEVKDHVLEVIRDDGVHRHIRLRSPGTMCCHFDLITWPGYLCYTGDMGTYVFRRLEDMFEFFRTDANSAWLKSKGMTLGINLGYWTEKLVAVDGNRGGGKVKEFDVDKFKRVINEYRVQWMRNAKADSILGKKGRRELWEAVDDEVLCHTEDGSERAQIAAYDFCHDPHANPKKPYGWSFHDLFEHDFTEFTHSIVWCCYALAWGIQKYDDSKNTEGVPQ